MAIMKSVFILLMSVIMWNRIMHWIKKPIKELLLFTCLTG